MPRVTLNKLLCGLVIYAAACSETDAGEGSETLYVVVSARSQVDSTQMTATLSKQGNDVVGANVVVRDVENNTSINLEGGASSDGYIYSGVLTGYARVIQLEIKSGDDDLVAQLGGPSAHVITRPPNDAIVRRQSFDELTIEWDAVDPADEVRVAIDQENPLILEEDRFRTDIPIGDIRNGAHTVSVERYNRVDLAGGTAGSRLEIRYRVDNRFTIE